MVALAAHGSITNTLSEKTPALIPGETPDALTVTFKGIPAESVIVLRGTGAIRVDPGNLPPEPSAEVENVTFNGSLPGRVRVVRVGIASSGKTPGASLPSPQLSLPMPDRTTETAVFADPRNNPVTVIKGSIFEAAAVDVFTPANQPDLDRMAFAIEALESSLGTDPRMWRSDPDAAQGPMQVTLAAAMDVGGGNRFSEADNRALGRAYLDHLYRRYGNWSDAVTAYNWGPGNVDGWIDAGRPADKFPLEVEHYRDRVLRRAGLAQPADSISTSDPPQVLRSPASAVKFQPRSVKSSY